MDKDKQRTNKNIDYSDIPPLTDVQLATMKPLREALPQAMPSTAEQAPLEQDEMLPEYDFTGKKGVRGKYHRAYQQGHTVKIQGE